MEQNNLENVIGFVPFIIGGSALGFSIGTLISYYVSSEVVEQFAKIKGFDYTKKFVEERMESLKNKGRWHNLKLVGTKMAYEKFLSRN